LCSNATLKAVLMSLVNLDLIMDSATTLMTSHNAEGNAAEHAPKRMQGHSRTPVVKVSLLAPYLFRLHTMLS
jgi:hypothetical protein